MSSKAKSLIRTELSRLIDADVFSTIEEFIENSDVTTANGQIELSDFLKEFCGNTPDANRVINEFIGKYLSILNIAPPAPPPPPQAYPKLDKTTSSPSTSSSSSTATSSSNVKSSTTAKGFNGARLSVPAVGPSLLGTTKGGTPLSAGSAVFVPVTSQFHVVEKKQSKKQQQYNNNANVTNSNGHSNSSSNYNASNSKPNKSSNSNSNSSIKRPVPETGGAPVVTCGCFGTNHPFFTSCRECGRLHCAAEAVNPNQQCLHCGEVLWEPMSEEDAVRNDFDPAAILAYRQKDRLLIFDKENAKRTHVFDSQSDYYDSSVWLSVEERKILQDKEQQRVERHKTRGMTVQISFDVAGRKILHHDFSDSDRGGTNSTTSNSSPNSNDSSNSSNSNGGNSSSSSTSSRNYPESSSSLRSSYPPESSSDKNLKHQELETEDTKVGFLFRKMMDSYKDDVKTGATSSKNS